MEQRQIVELADDLHVDVPLRARGHASSLAARFPWLAIFLICAYVIAMAAPSRLFLHGLLLGIANSVWVTAAHIGLFDAYMAHHAREAALMQKATMPLPPRLMMACVGPIVGAISGVMLGLLAMVAGWMLNRGARPAMSG